jgi:YegS/Rv2252/BmrU family lipid kinase
VPRLSLIFNPAAARADARVMRTVTRLLEEEGWDVEVLGTTKPGHAGELALRAVEEGSDTIAIYGGDGTMIQAVSAIVDRDVPIGLIPGGTGNLLAGNLRLPRNPELAARVILRQVTRRIDLGLLRSGPRMQYFAVACGAGVDAEVMAGTTGNAKRRWGMAAYAIRAAGVVWRSRPVRYRLTVDDRVLEVDALTVLVANCGEIIPPWLKLGHDIRMDDGLLDVVVLNADGLMDGAQVVGRLLLHRTGGDARILHCRGRRVTVETTPPRPVEADGEPFGATPVTAEVVPGAVRVLVSAGPATG